MKKINGLCIHAACCFSQKEELCPDACAHYRDRRFYDFGVDAWAKTQDEVTNFDCSEFTNELMDVAVKSGLCVHVPYDPETHGEMDADEGDMIYYWEDSDEA